MNIAPSVVRSNSGQFYHNETSVTVSAEHVCLNSFFLYILPDAIASIMGRCTLYTPGLQDESLQVTIPSVGYITVGFFNLHKG